MSSRHLISGISLSFLLVGSAFAAETAGNVLMLVGSGSIVRAGKELPMQRGTVIESGDLIRVADGSSAQIRFVDDGVVALRANSEFRIDEYRFTEKGDGDKTVFSLLKGGLRTITGVIGKRNPDNYEMRGGSATIGIRGTHYTVVNCETACFNADGSAAPKGMYGGVSEGRIVVKNNVDNKEFSRDQYFVVPSIDAKVTPLLVPPAFLRDKLDPTARSSTASKTAKAVEVVPAASTSTAKSEQTEAATSTAATTSASAATESATAASTDTAAASSSSSGSLASTGSATVATVTTVTAVTTVAATTSSATESGTTTTSTTTTTGTTTGSSSTPATQTPAGATQTPAGATQTPAGATQTPAGATQTPAVPAQTPAVPAQTPVVPAQTPAVPTQTPVVSILIPNTPNTNANTNAIANANGNSAVAQNNQVVLAETLDVAALTGTTYAATEITSGSTNVWYRLWSYLHKLFGDNKKTGMDQFAFANSSGHRIVTTASGVRTTKYSGDASAGSVVTSQDTLGSNLDVVNAMASNRPSLIRYMERDYSGTLTGFENGKAFTGTYTKTESDNTGDSDRAGNASWGRFNETIVQNFADGTARTTTNIRHWVIGDPLSSMPTSNTYTFTPAGGTRPTDQFGNTGTVIDSGAWTVNFAGKTIRTSDNVEWRMNNTSYAMTVPLQSYAVSTSNGSTTLTAANGANLSNVTTCSGGGCTSAASTISATLMGARATGLAVGISSTATVTGGTQNTNQVRVYGR